MARRKIGEVNKGSRSAKIYRDSEWQEYRVRLYVNRVLNPAADYHTDSEADAFDTARAMVWVLSSYRPATPGKWFGRWGEGGE